VEYYHRGKPAVKKAVNKCVQKLSNLFMVLIRLWLFPKKGLIHIDVDS